MNAIAEPDPAAAVFAAPATPAAAPEKVRVVIATPPRFLNRKEAGAYLCASDDYLRINAKRHDLYKPSVAHSGQGSACRYDRDHLDIIALHMKNPEVFDEDTALLVWKRGEMNAIQDKLEKAKSRKAKP
ncbi:MAG: hypothetical protein LBU23_02770 [Planctomycetota bacterium]|jgi:hypothetical protein|nr:hypothetical protein [Planctomycetota bacterium]